MAGQQKKLYFTAGPAKIPEDVMKKAHEELLDYKGMGTSVMEISHRSKQFEDLVNEAKDNLRKLMDIPEDYAILFMHGGAKTQFSLVPMNLFGYCTQEECKVDYIVNGTWSKMAATDAEAYCSRVDRQLVQTDGNFVRIPIQGELEEKQGCIYRYYCDNETVEGVEFNYVPETDEGNTFLVCDMTSNFLSRPVDVTKFGIIFAGAQKNCGISGLVVVIIDKRLIGRNMKCCPKTLNYKTVMENNSLYNTPPTFAIYMANLCFKWILGRGGLAVMDNFSKAKSQMIYDLIDNSGGFYVSPVERGSRSRMNVVFKLGFNGLDDKFLEQAKLNNLYDLKGHRSVGGFRASIYHGMSLDDVYRLVSFMAAFKENHGTSRSVVRID